MIPQIRQPIAKWLWVAPKHVGGSRSKISTHNAVVFFRRPTQRCSGPPLRGLRGSALSRTELGCMNLTWQGRSGMKPEPALRFSGNRNQFPGTRGATQSVGVPYGSAGATKWHSGEMLTWR